MYKNRGYNGYPSGFSPAPYSYNQPQGRGFYRGAKNWSMQPMQKKHSGAKFHASTKNGNSAISAWNASKSRGMISILVAPYKGTKMTRSKSGREWHSWIAKVTFKNTGQTQIYPVLVDGASHKCVIKELGLIINPNAPNGGYCGTFSRRR